jgi:hypothetical protein
MGVLSNPPSGLGALSGHKGGMQQTFSTLPQYKDFNTLLMEQGVAEVIKNEDAKLKRLADDALNEKCYGKDVPVEERWHAPSDEDCGWIPIRPSGDPLDLNNMQKIAAKYVPLKNYSDPYCNTAKEVESSSERGPEACWSHRRI